MGIERNARLAPSRPDKGVKVLLVSPREDEFASLSDVFSHSNWTLDYASSIAEANDLLRAQPVPVVIIAGDTPDCDWKELAAIAKGSAFPPKIIVTVRFSEANHWMDVIQQGGYDVLPKPYDRSEVFQVVGFAWLEWKRDFERRQPAADQRSNAATAGAQYLPAH